MTHKFRKNDNGVVGASEQLCVGFFEMLRSIINPIYFELMERLLESLSDALGDLVVTLSERQAGQSLAVSVDGVRAFKAAIDCAHSLMETTMDVVDARG